jgi:hypothetical protein
VTGEAFNRSTDLASGRAYKKRQRDAAAELAARQAQFIVDEQRRLKAEAAERRARRAAS